MQQTNRYGFMKFSNLTYKNRTDSEYRIIACGSNLKRIALLFEKCLLTDIKKGEPNNYLFFETDNVIDILSYENIVNVRAPSFKIRTHIYSNRKVITSWDTTSNYLYNQVLGLCQRLVELTTYTKKISNMDKIALIKEYKKVFGAYPSYYFFESWRSRRDLITRKKEYIIASI